MSSAVRNNVDAQPVNALSDAVETAMDSTDAKRETFRKYLEKTGVIESITKTLSNLCKEPDRPTDVLGYVKANIGSVDALKQENENLRNETNLFKAGAQLKITTLEKRVHDLESALKSAAKEKLEYMKQSGSEVDGEPETAETNSSPKASDGDKPPARADENEETDAAEPVEISSSPESSKKDSADEPINLASLPEASSAKPAERLTPRLGLVERESFSEAPVHGKEDFSHANAMDQD